AFTRFEILERRVDEAEGRAAAAALGGPGKSLEEEIDELESDDRVEAELAAMKKEQGKKGPAAAKEA
ncbi:MAG: hypothetical protein HKN78_00615, partial [Sphingomonadaceae bacterium]|nr:hypothetical protein [Sphingomonadaceae bacterium]